MTTTPATPLPVAQEVRELVEGLLGRAVESHTAAKGVDLKQNRENLVGVYVTDEGHSVAIILVDLNPDEASRLKRYEVVAESRPVHYNRVCQWIDRNRAQPVDLTQQGELGGPQL